CKPNPAHYAAAELQQLLPQLLCVTQNVDGFHALAGLSQILEMHGNIYRTRCLSCKTVAENKSEITPTTPCPACGKIPLRPDVVWFGEALPRAVMDPLHERLQVADAILVVGTSGTVYPAAGFAVEVRRRRGAVIEINIDTAHRPYADDIYLHGKAGDLLPAIVAELRQLT
ncbi:MAG TPA: Sir2 family NAD-dependent protein deacetylase, partial [Turneriella sp.]|nr:Sir2 family NAD-dependent protein deacetylase [Turneriella sp.]